MFLEQGYVAWKTRYLAALQHFQPTKPGLSAPPEMLNPISADLTFCVEHAPQDFQRFKDCKSEFRLLNLISSALAESALFPAYESLISISGKLKDKKLAPIAFARKLLWKASDEARAYEKALLTVMAYALVGYSVCNTPAVDRYAHCQICWFRQPRPAKRYCPIHSFSHAVKGKENPYALRHRARQLHQMLFSMEGTMRDAYRGFLMAAEILPADEAWWPIIEGYGVDEHSLQFLNCLIDDCQHIHTALTPSVQPYLAAHDWPGLFALLRNAIDPLDFRTDLHSWCAKLLQFEAWEIVYNRIKGQWNNIPIRSSKGKLLRSGQHVGGVRGPTKKTQSLMNAALDLAWSGKSNSEIATHLDISLRVLRQWEIRYPNFAVSLRAHARKFDLKSQLRNAS